MHYPTERPNSREMVYVVILNWNGWKDTIACLETVLRSDYPAFKAIVCDNSSSDSSMERISSWAEKGVAAEVTNPALNHLISPALPKPVPFTLLSVDAPHDAIVNSERLILVETGDNRGFAGGVNVGLRLALRAGDCDYAWILNNDTLVEPDAMTKLVHRLREQPDAGVCGSTILNYEEPGIIQTLGGSEYNVWTARGRPILGGYRITHAKIEPNEVERRLQYIVGASMLVRCRFLEEIGLMSERYFLYFEEIDWAFRARSRFKLAYAQGSVVYHKEGASTGSNTLKRRTNPICDFYSARNRILVSRKYFPLACVTAAGVVLLKACAQALRRDLQGSVALLRGALEGLRGRTEHAERILP